MKDTVKYIVKNAYGISGQSRHKTPKAALNACRRREGEGWIVVDSNGGRWIEYAGKAVKL